MKITTIIELVNPQSNGKLIAAELRRQGYEVQILNMRKDDNFLVEQVTAFQPDVIFGTHTHSAISPSATRRMKEIASKPLMVLWYVDGYSPRGQIAGESFRKTKGIYDLSLVTVKGLLPDFEKMRYSGWVAWAPQYFDNVFFKPTIKRTDEFDVCFLGNIYPYATHRIQFVEALKQRFKVLAGGNGLGGLVYGQACADVYMRSKIAIDIPSGLPKTQMLFSDRIYRAMGLGCLFISQNAEGIEQMFTPGVHLDMYDDTVQGLCDKIEYYLKCPVEMKQIAAQGQAKIMADHTIGTRVRQYVMAIEHVMKEKR